MEILYISLNMGLTVPLCYLGNSFGKRRADVGAGEGGGDCHGVSTELFESKIQINHCQSSHT